jgi:CheY-like chemotaxis protein
VFGTASYTPLRDPKSLPDLSRLTVVVVDDMDCMRNLVRGLLEVAGVRRIKAACDATEAWDLICGDKPNLLITDWQMKGKSGIDLVRDVRRSPQSPNPFMATMIMTSFSEEYRVHRALSEGISCYLAKPFSAAQFFSKLKFCVEDTRCFESSGDYFGPQRTSRSSEVALID